MPLVEVDRAPVQSRRLADAETGAVEELDERPVAQRARRRPRGGVDQPLGLGRPRASAAASASGAAAASAAAGLSSRAPSSSWWRKKARTAATRRATVEAASAGRAHLGEPALELLGRRLPTGPCARRRAARGRAGTRRRSAGARAAAASSARNPVRASGSWGGRSHRPCGDVSRRRGCRPAWSRATSGRAAPGSCAGRRRPRAGGSRTSAAGGAGGGASRRSVLVSSRRPRAERKSASFAPRASSGRASRR